ncbi:MAG: S-(hydroxymethyl)glutathione dehydrogenase / alcohol dehydrogenase [Frankiales bacterium]|nr:S-(hydroxymethyl)glutathione dehydrogenase / alcohol dehydrogenase [Frankiales bacterium]
MVRAAVLREIGIPMRVEDIVLPETGAGQVRVRIVAAGVCHSDLSLANGTLRQPTPAVLGHEGAGIVSEVGDGVTNVEPGDHVLLIWSAPCRDCWHCLRDEPWLCERAGEAAARPYAWDGGGHDLYPGLGVAAFAEETLVAGNAVVRLPEDLALDTAALLGCAVITGVGAVLNSAQVMQGETVAIFGLGGVGLSAVQGARIAGAAQIITVDPSGSKEEMARKLGATEVLTTGADVVARMRELTDGRGVDHAFECVGRAEAIRTAWSSTRRGGRTTVVGMGSREDTVSFNALELAYFARRLEGCLYGSADPAVDIPILIDHVNAGRLDLQALISDRIGLDDIDSAFERMGVGHGARNVVTFG